jgi:FKBP-type peptidyl-prolyl cis-trans isomerase SlyD
MGTLENKYITVAYKLYSIENGERDFEEEASPEHPFQFISGLGLTLELFEKEVQHLQKGDKFDFTIACTDAYGEYDDDHVIELPKQIFEIDGKFDSERIVEGNVIPLMTAEGQRINGTVSEVKTDVVIMDMNHPLAGCDLNFVGEIVENRAATNEELEEIVKSVSGDGCSCGSDGCGCGGGCGSQDGEDECGCGNSGGCGCH